MLCVFLFSNWEKNYYKALIIIIIIIIISCALLIKYLLIAIMYTYIHTCINISKKIMMSEQRTQQLIIFEAGKSLSKQMCF